MRATLVLGPLAVLVVTSLAAADPAVVDVDGAASRLTPVLAAGDAQQLEAMLATKVKVAKVTFADKACDKAFGQKKRRTITKTKLAQLAACVAGADWRPAADATVSLTSNGAQYAVGSRRTLNVTFAASKDGSTRIATLSMTEPKRKVIEVVQPVKIEKDPDASDDGIPDDDTCYDCINGEVGGVVGGVSAAPPPPPPPPPPPAAPQNVSPTAVETLRIAGSKLITPDDTTKEAIARTGKEKVVASFKMCLGASGDVSTVNQLKSSGFPDYDTKLKAGIRTRRYRPYEIDGKAVPVCTAVTFVYSQK